MSDDCRAQRIAKAWLAPLAAAGVGIASTGALAAMPAASTAPHLSRLILVQQATEGEEAGATAGEPARAQATPDSFSELHEALAAARERLDELSRAAQAVAASGEVQRELAAARQQNQQLRAEIETLRAERDELNAAKQAAEARAIEASRAAEQAIASAQEIDQELVAVRWQNAQLNTSLAQARARRDQIETEARQTQSALRAQTEELQAGAAAATAEAVRLRAELDEKEQQIEVAARARADAERQLAEARDRARQAEQEAAAAGERLAAVETELAAAKQQLASAEREHAQAVQRTTALAEERDGLRRRLAGVTERLEQAEAANSQLENQVVELRAAAGTATDVARQNLIAVEDRIRELNEALEAIRPAGGPFEPDLSLAERPSELAVVETADIEAVPSLTSVENRVAPPGNEDAQAVLTDAVRSEPDVDLVRSADAEGHLDSDAGATMLAGLPLEERLQVQGLLADLDAQLEKQGLKTIVPGELLFVFNGETVQERAHDTLAKVAELISVYDDRKVLIVGHTDAVGDAAYNKELSERRAELVKQFFVDNFDVEEDRLSTQGLGEERPITSDATAEGRRANRRVEVLILN